MPQYYKKPTLPMDAALHQVVPENQHGDILKPETKVVIVHRGDQPLVVKWDARDHVIRPGYNEVEYQVALNAQAHLIVPGSRNVETGTFESYIGIVGIDPPEMCEPLSPVENAAAQAKVEAIDRTGQDGKFKVLQTSTARARMSGQGAGRARRPVSDGSVQASPAAMEAARYAMQPPSGGEAASVSRGAAEAEI